MRHHPHEVNGSRVRLHYQVELQYTVDAPSEFLLNVHAARTPRQAIVSETFLLEPHGPQVGFTLLEDEVTANRIAAFATGAGPLRVRYEADVEITHDIVEPSSIVAETPSALPVQVLRYLYPSRYCEADLLRQRAWDTFGSLPRGYAQVRTVRDWVHEHLRFKPGASGPSTSVVDTLRDGAGVCRDFAHTTIAFCRALNYPARFVTGVDYGADPGLGPPDFHAYCEVFVGGRWFILDSTGISPLTGLVRIGTGRDAADVSFATMFGMVRHGMPSVSFHAVEDVVSGLALPVATDLAVSTAA